MNRFWDSKFTGAPPLLSCVVRRRRRAAMGCLLIPVVVVLLALVNAATVRSLRRRQAGAGWWTALSAAWLAGAAAGVWGGFFFEYQPSPRLRVFGAPVPAAFFHWEGPPGEEQWVDFITPVPLLFAGSNVPIMALLCACPVGVLFWVWVWTARRSVGSPNQALQQTGGA